MIVRGIFDATLMSGPLEKSREGGSGQAIATGDYCTTISGNQDRSVRRPGRRRRDLAVPPIPSDIGPAAPDAGHLPAESGRIQPSVNPSATSSNRRDFRYEKGYREGFESRQRGIAETSHA